MRPVSPLVLHGRHVRLEPFEPAHLSGLEAIDADEAIWRYMGRDVGPYLDWIRAWASDASQAGTRGEVVFVIRDLASGALVGSTRYLNVVTSHDRLEIGGTWYAKVARGTAVNPECKLLLMQYAFDELGARRVELKCDARNEHSRRAIAKLGATEEGILRKHMRLESGFVRDTVYFSVLREEWPGVRARLEQRLAQNPI